jgi:large subunit ribosomal protein L15
MKIHDAKPKTPRQSRRRVGRGHGSGYGRTAGRGEKGAKSRSGWSIKPGFEGGTLPLVRRLPKRGFSNYLFRTAWAEVNVDQLARFDAGSTVDEAALKAAGLIKGGYDKVVILGRGDLEVALTVRVDRVTRGAVAKITAAGGTVELVEGEAEAAAAPEPEAAVAEQAAADEAGDDSEAEADVPVSDDADAGDDAAPDDEAAEEEE